MKLKKGFTNIILSLILVGAFALAGFGVELIPPLWDDFCPDGLENAEYKEIKWFWPEGTKSTQEIYNYWANRRKEFQSALFKCNLLDIDNQGECYAGLKKRQLFFNEQYKRGIQQQQITRQDWRDIHAKGSSPFMINIFQFLLKKNF